MMQAQKSAKIPIRYEGKITPVRNWPYYATGGGVVIGPLSFIYDRIIARAMDLAVKYHTRKAEMEGVELRSKELMCLASSDAKAATVAVLRSKGITDLNAVIVTICSPPQTTLSYLLLHDACEPTLFGKHLLTDDLVEDLGDEIPTEDFFNFEDDEEEEE